MAVANRRVTCGNDATAVTAAPPLAVRQPDLGPLSVARVPVLWWHVERGAAPSRRGGGTGGQGGVAQQGRKGGGGSIPAGSGPTGDCRTSRQRISSLASATASVRFSLNLWLLMTRLPCP